MNEALALQYKNDDMSSAANTLHNIAETYRQESAVQEALNYLQKSFALRHLLGDKGTIAMTLYAFAQIHFAQGQRETALTIHAATHRLQSQLGLILPAEESVRIAAETDSLRQSLPADTFDILWAQGQLLSLDDTVAFALEPTGA